MLSPATLPVRSKDVLTRDDGEGLLLFQTRTDEMHYLSRNCFEVFRLCDGAHTVGEIESLLAVYQPALATEEGREKIEGFLADLANRDLVELWGE